MSILEKTALKAINDLFSDTSVSKKETAVRLSSLVDEIESLLATIDVDEKE